MSLNFPRVRNTIFPKEKDSNRKIVSSLIDQNIKDSYTPPENSLDTVVCRFITQTVTDPQEKSPLSKRNKTTMIKAKKGNQLLQTCSLTL